MITLYQNKTEPAGFSLRLFIRTAKVLTGKHDPPGEKNLVLSKDFGKETTAVKDRS